MPICYITQAITKLIDYNPNALSVKYIKYHSYYSIIKFMNNSKYLILYCNNQKPKMTQHELKMASKCCGVLFVLKEENENLKYILSNYDILKNELENHLKKTENLCCFKFQYYFYYTRLINAGVEL